MIIPALLAITSHGNAPYLMASRFAKALGNSPVVIPHYYGDTQISILRDEIPEMSGRIFLSTKLGKLFKPLLLDAEKGLRFTEFGALLVKDDNPFSVRAIENMLVKLLDEGIPATSLDGVEDKRFYRSDFSATINTTLPIRVNLPRSYFFFTAKMSDLYGLPPAGDNSVDTMSAVDDLLPYAKLWAEVEDTFDIEFIPRINAFSYRQNYLAPKVIHTPPFAFARPVVNLLSRESILIVPSGTRTDLGKLHQIAESIPPEYDRLILGSMGSNRDFPENIYRYVGANVFGDPKLIGVISRGGWGTIWECLANIKPDALASTTFVEDPEMGHTQKTMEKLGLAEIINGSAASFLKEEIREKIVVKMNKEKEIDIQQFGPYANDGYGYIASKIHEMGS
jgi:hypothetical protein